MAPRSRFRSTSTTKTGNGTLTGDMLRLGITSAATGSDLTGEAGSYFRDSSKQPQRARALLCGR